jgi:hypothetical protein
VSTDRGLLHVDFLEILSGHSTSVGPIGPVLTPSPAEPGFLREMQPWSIVELFSNSRYLRMDDREFVDYFRLM